MDKIDQKRLGDKIRQHRKKQQMTTEGLGRLCGVSGSYIRQLESGLKKPSLELAVTVCRVLEVSADVLLRENTVFRMDSTQFLPCGFSAAETKLCPFGWTILEKGV